MGVVLWDLVKIFSLFDAIDIGSSHYYPAEHLGLTIALMRPSPKEILDRGSTSPMYFDEQDRFRYPPCDNVQVSTVARVLCDSLTLTITFM